MSKKGNALLEKLMGSGSIKGTLVNESDYFNDKDLTKTSLPILNIALSGDIDGGMAPGLTVLAGPSKHYKSSLTLLMVAAYLEKYPEAAAIFYDCEFGITVDYMKAHGVDSSRVIHVPVANIEELKFDFTQKLDSIQRGDKVIFFIDSLGNIASKKEVEDALEGRGAADMSRAKAMKSLLRIITAELNKKEIPCIGVAHSYKEQSLYPKDIVGGGTGMMYAPNSLFIISRSQEKDGTEVIGYNFTLNVEKSRFIREKSKLSFQVIYKEGIQRLSGLLDIAMEGGFITKPKVGWYAEVNKETGEVSDKLYRLKDLDPVLESLLTNTTFKEYVKERYKL